MRACIFVFILFIEILFFAIIAEGNLDIIWNKTYGDSGDDTFGEIIETKDGNLVIQTIYLFVDCGRKYE